MIMEYFSGSWVGTFKRIFPFCNALCLQAASKTEHTETGKWIVVIKMYRVQIPINGYVTKIYCWTFKESATFGIYLAHIYVPLLTYIFIVSFTNILPLWSPLWEIYNFLSPKLHKGFTK